MHKKQSGLHREILFVAAFFVGLTILLYWPMVKGLVLLPLDLLLHSYPPWAAPGTLLVKNPYMQDSIVQMYPWKQFVFSSVILEEDLPIALREGTGSARLVGASPNALRFDVETSSPGVFYLSYTFYPGWQATVNGKRSHIYRANYDFRAVSVPEGRSTVSLWYEPSNVRLWIGVSAASIVVAVLLSLRRRQPRAKRYRHQKGLRV